jgi:hypothetical protein
LIANFFEEDLKKMHSTQQSPMLSAGPDILMIHSQSDATDRKLNYTSPLHQHLSQHPNHQANSDLFLDIDVYRRQDGSLGHRAHMKPIYTNHSLNAWSHHHLANKLTVLSTLVHKTHCDTESLHVIPENLPPQWIHQPADNHGSPST